MPLPTDVKAPWPPKSEVDCQRDITEADAWYSGDQNKLITFYGGPQTTVKDTGWSRFWTRRSTDNATGRQRIHVPAAADVAATSADLLFGDTPRFVIPEAHEFGDTADGTATDQPTNPDAKDTEDRLNELAEEDGWASTLLEAAEIGSALGGFYLRPAWDQTLADRPLLTFIHPDHAVPEWRWGQLVAVTFWREVLRDDKGVVWRHLERHETVNGTGVILHGLYAGDADRLGISRPLGEHAETAGLADEIPLPGGIRLDVRYVKNALNRRHRGKPIGRADTSGCEDIMDALDETMTAWMREIRLAKPRIIVPSEFLESKGRGRGKTFDVDAEIFSPLEMDPANQEKAGITVAEFDLHTEKYAATCLDLFERIVRTAGYSPGSFGLQSTGVEGGGGLKTATQVDSEDSKSNRTTGRKQGYTRRPLEDVLEMLLIIDREVFGSGVTPMRPRVEFIDPDASNPREIGSTLNLINLARAASIETRVRMLNPDWEEPQVQAEVARIKDEEGMNAVPDPTGFPAGAGVP